MVSLTTRVALAGGLVASVLVAVVGSASFVALRNQTMEGIASTTRHSAELHGRQLAITLGGVASHQMSTAGNSLIANGLADTVGRDAYVKPFLADLREINGLSLAATMTDHRGRPLATTLVGEQQPASLDLARRAIAEARQVGGVFPRNDGVSHLVFATPIFYASTGTAEGALIYELDLPDLSQMGGVGEFVSRIDLAIGPQPAEIPPRWGVAVFTEKLPADLWLTVSAVADESRLSRPLAQLVWNTAAIGLACLVLVAFGSRVLARAVTHRLRQLEGDAARVVATASFSDRFAVQGGDEVSRLAKSFNAVLDRLEAAHRDIAGQAELRLQDSEARYRLLAEYASDVIARIDEDGVIRYISPAAMRSYGYAPADVTGTAVVDYVHPEDRTLVTEGLEQARLGDIRELVFRLRGTDGGWNWVEASAHGTDGGRDLVAIIRDIRKRRMIEEALADKTRDLERSNAELEQFAYVASHDLREPLRMVTSYLQLIARRLKGSGDAEIAEFLGFATDGAKRMDQLILDMLEFSRVGRNRPESEPVGIEEALAVAAETFRASLPEGGAITVAPSEALVLGDRQEIIRLFQNLIGNGMKYRRGDRVPVIAITIESGDAEAVVSVADNGIGIAAEHYDRIFQIFQRLHGREQFEGTGIGLAICRKIIDRHDGRIWLESKLGEGTTFHVALPLARG